MSDNETTITDLKEMVKKFCEERDWDKYHTPMNLSVGLVIESAELLDHFRSLSDEEQLEAMSNPEKSKKIRDELSDAIYWILRFAQMYNIDISESLKSKTEENGRKYPVEKAKGSNKKYDEL